MIGALDSRFWWWVSRASGIVAWLVVAAAVVWGLLASTKLIRRRGMPAWILDLHRYLGTLTIVFVAIHVGSIYADSFVKFGPRSSSCRSASTWRPHAVNVGHLQHVPARRDPDHVVGDAQAAEKALAPDPRLSIPMLAMATVHGFLAGTDRRNALVQWGALVTLATVMFLLAVRLLSPSRSARATAPTAIRRPREPSEAVAAEA